MTDTILIIAILVPCLVVAIVFHEVAHGWTALMLGDPTAKERNRLSLNPLTHVDPVGTLLVPGLMAVFGGPIFGWAKPVPVLKNRLNNPRFGMMLVAAAGPGTNLILAIIGAIALGVTMPAQPVMAAGDTGMMLISAADGGAALLATGMFYFVLINVFLAIFNLLPIPPFDGSHIVEGALPRKYVGYYEKLRPFGMLLFFGLIALTWFAPGLGVLENTVGVPVNWALEKFFALATWIASAL